MFDSCGSEGKVRSTLTMILTLIREEIQEPGCYLRRGVVGIWRGAHPKGGLGKCML